MCLFQNEEQLMSMTTKKQERESADGISIKGTREGLVVTIGGGKWSELMNELTRHLRDKTSFFGGAQAILDAGPRELVIEDLIQIRELFSANRMEMCGVRTTAPQTLEAAAALEIPVKTVKDYAVRSIPESHLDQQTEEALFLKRTIRSGQVVQHPGHITIIGDVNPGAEVVAGGDIIIWGKLRGTVHAGARGDNSAVVSALFFAPTQLRIGNHIARSPEGEERNAVVPEIARVDKNGIVVEPWNASKQ